ncbi:MAG: serine hydrolase [Sphingomonas sp.]
MLRAARVLAAMLIACATPAVAAIDSDRLDALIASADFTGVALVGAGDALVYERSVGPVRAGMPHDADSPWRLASVTKQLVALIAMQEVAAGRLDLDASVAALWPGWPGPAAVTPRMLLRHESGLADPAGSKPDNDGVPEFYRRAGPAADPARNAAGYCAASRRAAPGSGYHYNNCDFIVLGALLERLAGRPLATLLEERIASPLGLATLGLFRFDAPPAPHVSGTVAGKAEPALNLGSYGGAGSAYVSPRELWLIDSALLRHRLLDRVATRQMWAGDPAIGFAAFGSWAYATRLAGCPDTVDLVERRGMIGGVQVRNFIAPARAQAVLLFADTADFDFGEVGAGRGFAYDMLAAVLCPAL